MDDGLVDEVNVLIEWMQGMKERMMMMRMRESARRGMGVDINIYRFP